MKSSMARSRAVNKGDTPNLIFVRVTDPPDDGIQKCSCNLIQASLMYSKGG